jgi:soluble epoxide hydrolase/lipid-phosphate phosphatase
MEEFVEKKLTVSRGFEYRYFVSSSEHEIANPPTLVFLHGFRDFASSWRFVLPHLKQLPCRFLVPDLLGHSGSSKPTNPKSYAYHLMAQDLLEIIDAEQIKKFVPIGHDHGSLLAQRIYNHHPARCAGLVILNVAYSPPSSKPFDLYEINAMTNQIFGYGTSEYFHFLTSPDAARLMNANLDRVWDIPHTNSFSDMRSLYGSPTAMREYLTDDSIPSKALKPYATDPSFKVAWKSEIEKGGLEAPLCWYTAMVQQVQYHSDKLIASGNTKVDVPMLFIGCDGDAPCRPELIKLTMDSGLLPDLTIHTLQGVGHWPMYEQPERTAEILVEFLATKVGLIVRVT